VSAEPVENVPTVYKPLVKKDENEEKVSAIIPAKKALHLM